MKRILVLVVLLLTFLKTFSQSYQVEVELLLLISSGCTPYLNQAEVSLSGQAQSTYMTYDPLPQKIFDYTFATQPSNELMLQIAVACSDEPIGGIYLCSSGGFINHIQAINFNPDYACLPQIFYINTDCSNGGGPPISNIEMTFAVKWSPQYATPTQSGIDICEGDNLTLSTTSGYSSYNWEYKDSNSSTFKPFFTNPGTRSSISFGIDQVYGSSYQDKLGNGNSIEFQVGIGSCPRATTTSPIHFFPKAPQVLEGDFTVSDPPCNGGTGSIVIDKFNRNILPGELFEVSVFRAIDPVKNGIPIEQDTISGGVINFSGIPSGDYKLFVRSIIYQCGDTLNPLVTPFSIIEPAPVTFTNQVPISPSCHTNTTGTKNNGSITLTALGGTETGYMYSKDDGVTYQSSNILNGLTTGNYLVQVKDSNGCESDSVSITVEEPDDIIISPTVVSSDYNGREVSCAGQSDGEITTAASQAGNLLEFSLNGIDYQPSTIFTNLASSISYTVTVKDGKGCTKNADPITLADTPPLVISSIVIDNASCFNVPDGSVTFSASGGTNPLRFSFDNSSFGSTNFFPNKLAGDYSIAVRDTNQCVTSTSISIKQPLPIGVTATPTLVTCAGGSDGTVEITASNAVGTPTYSFNGGAFVASNVFTGLAANTYPLSVRDANGCIGTGSVTINSNPIITGSITVANTISCNGASDGALNLSPGGGVGPYTFLWSTGATSEDISALPAATYSVTITDSENCQQSFNRALSQPLPVAVTYFTSDFNGSGVSCFGSSDGSIDISSSGGNGGYTYAWSNGAVTEDIGGLIAGTYSVTVTDSKSCTGDQTIIISQPDQLVSAISSTQNIACFGGNTGSIALTTTGGTTDYEYSIDGGSSWQSSSTFSNLVATDYTLLTRDANGCSDSDGTTLTSPADLILVIDNVTNTTCNQNNGGASASASGGVSNYTFNWFNSGNTQIGTGNSISNLAAGVYRIEVIDQNSCSKQQNVTISSSDGPSITVQSVTATSCSNTADGSATISITQGESPYSILWPNNQTTVTATNLAGGDYIVEVRDNTNCLALQTITVPAPAPLIIQTITAQDPNCFGNADGEIEVLAQGGNGGYAYNWSTGATGTLLTNLPAGTYNLTTTDSKNCEMVESFILINPPVFTIDLGEDEKICEGQTIIKQSEVDNAVYVWTGPDNFLSDQQQVSISQPGVYTLTVINQNGCEASDSFTLSFDTDLLKADFLMVSEAFAGDTIIVIDISWPVPTTVAWQFDAAAVVLDQSQDFSLIRFDEPGDYTISMLAQLATCASSHSQSISILENTDDGSGGRISSEKIIRALTIYPNPTTDKLDVTIELNKAHRAVMEIYHLHSNRKELSEIFDGNTVYESDLSLAHLQSGLYVLVVKAGKEIKSMKLIKL